MEARLGSRIARVRRDFTRSLDPSQSTSTATSTISPSHSLPVAWYNWYIWRSSRDVKWLAQSRSSIWPLRLAPRKLDCRPHLVGERSVMRMSGIPYFHGIMLTRIQIVYPLCPHLLRSKSSKPSTPTRMLTIPEAQTLNYPKAHCNCLEALKRTESQRSGVQVVRGRLHCCRCEINKNPMI